MPNIKRLCFILLLLNLPILHANQLQQQISNLESMIQAQQQQINMLQQKIQLLEYAHPQGEAPISEQRLQALQRSHPLSTEIQIIESIEELNNNLQIKGQVNINGALSLQVGETINEFSNDSKLSKHSQQSVATEYAVKTYIDFVVSILQNQINTLTPSDTQIKIADAMFNFSSNYSLNTDYTLQKNNISLNKNGFYAIYFQVTLAKQRQLILNMNSDFDGYMFLYNRKGQQIAFDDDSGGNGNPKIEKELESGLYLIECTSYVKGVKGKLKLTLGESAIKLFQ